MGGAVEEMQEWGSFHVEHSPRTRMPLQGNDTVAFQIPPSPWSAHCSTWNNGL